LNISKKKQRASGYQLKHLHTADCFETRKGPYLHKTYQGKLKSFHRYFDSEKKELIEKSKIFYHQINFRVMDLVYFVLSSIHHPHKSV